MERQKVRISKLPANYGVQTPPSSTVAYPGSGFPNYGNDLEVGVNHILGPTSPENATLEAERGETVVTNLQKEGIPEFYTVGGKPHSQGGTPLNLPADSFFFSKFKDLKIKDPDILKIFGKSGSKPMVPADISKQYDLNKYREILANPFTDVLQKETAELMIKNYNLKLGALALIQEARKGFDKGIPGIAIPYLENMGINPEELLLGNNAPTGDQLQKFRSGGSYVDNNTGTSRVRIVKLPRLQSGGMNDGRSEKEVATAPTRKQNIPSTATVWDKSSSDYSEDNIKPGDYILDNGSYYRVKGTKVRAANVQFKDDKVGKFQDNYAYLYEKFQDPKFKEAFVKQYREEIGKAKPNASTGLKQADIDKAASMSDEDIVNTFLYKQKVNMAINTEIGDLSEADKKNLWDHDENLSQNLTEKLGYKKFDKSQIAAFQAGYIGLNNLANTPEYSGLVKDLKLGQTGLFNDQVTGTAAGSISKIDGWDGNTTSGQIAFNIATDLDIEEAPWETAQAPEATKALQPAAGTPEGQWWTQDLVNMSGAFGDLMRAKKYSPWGVPAPFTPANPTFTDFRGTAARIGSQGTGLAESAATFAGPQAFGAIAANIQRGMVDPILQTQQQEIQTNNAVANQFEQFNVAAKNEHDRYLSGFAADQYDKQMIANQQFDNTKTALRQNLRNAFNQGWTNKGATQSLNATHDNYAVDPVTGYTYFTGNKQKIKPVEGRTKTFEETIADIKNRHPDWEEATVRAAAKADTGIFDDEEDYPAGVNPAAYTGYPGGN